MQRTVDEKYKYNKGQKTDFAGGYCIGVDVYRNYVKMNDEGKNTVHKSIDSFMRLARTGDRLSKGIIAGYRDAANERKKQ